MAAQLGSTPPPGSPAITNHRTRVRSFYHANAHTVNTSNMEPEAFELDAVEAPTPPRPIQVGFDPLVRGEKIWMAFSACLMAVITAIGLYISFGMK